MANYNIEVKTGNNLSVNLEGKFTETDAMNFIQDFNKKVKTIKPTEFVLSFDSSKLQVSTQDMLPVLKGCFEMYKQLGFKKVNINVGSSAVLKMQVNRVIKESGLVNCELAS